MSHGNLPLLDLGVGSPGPLIKTEEEVQEAIDKNAGVDSIVLRQDGTIDLVNIAPGLRADADDDVQGKGDFQITMKANKTAFIRLQGSIGGWFGIRGQEFAAELDTKAKNATLIILEIDSPGGSVFDAAYIYNALVQHQAEVQVKIMSVAASAASLIAMAGDRIEMVANGFFMVHQVRPTEKQLEGMIDLVRNANQAMKQTYAGRTGMTLSELDDLIGEKDVWLGADEAMEKGFIDSIIPVKKKEKKDKAESDKPAPAKSYLGEWKIGDAAQAVTTLMACAGCDDGGRVQPPNPSRPTKTATTPPTKGDTTVNFELWLKAQGIDPTTLTADELESWKHIYDSGKQPPASQNGESEGTGDTIAPAGDAAANTASLVDDMNAAAANTLRRHSAIAAKCGTFQDLAAKAIENGWDDERIDVELRAAKAEAQLTDLSGEGGDDDFAAAFRPNIQSRSRETTDKAIVGATCLAMGMSEEDLINPFGDMSRSERRAIGMPRLESYTEQEIDNAARFFDGSLRELAAYSEYKDGRSSMMRYRGEQTIEASFSTVTFPTTLLDVVNRSIIAGFRAVTPKWSKYAAATRVDDFKAQQFYRVYGTGRWQKLSSAGTLKHGELKAEDAYSVRAFTEGQVLEVTRELVVNNDLGPITNMATMFARMGRLAPEFGCWDFVNDTYVTAGNTFDFTYEAMKELWKAFCRKTAFDPNGQVDKDAADGFAMAIDVEPANLLCHKVREIDMNELLNGQPVQLDDGAVTEVRTIANALKGMMNVVASSYMAAEDAVVLLPGPTIAPAIVVAFLNGRQVPTVNRVPLDNNKLGFGLQGFIDFGVNEADSFLPATPEDVVVAALGDGETSGERRKAAVKKAGRDARAGSEPTKKADTGTTKGPEPGK